MKIALTGGTGFIGSHLAESLTSRGHEVTCLVRPTSNLRWLRGLPVRTVQAELGDSRSLGEFLRGAQAIVHTSGAKFASSQREFSRGNLGQTRNLYDAMDRMHLRPERFVYVSSIAVAGPSRTGSPISEDMPPHPITPYGVSKHDAERFVRSKADRVPFTIVRPPGVYGPRDKDLYIYFRLVRNHLRPILGRSHRFDFIYVKNLAHGLALAVESDRARNQTYYFADAHPYSWRSFTEYVREAVGTWALSVRPPLSLAFLAAGAASSIARTVGKPLKLDRNKVREFGQRYWLVSCRKAQEELGYEAPYDAEQAMRETVEWYRAEGWLR